MQDNIYIALDLFLDPASTTEVELRKDLEVKIKQWNKDIANRYKGNVEKARQYFTDLERQEKKARENKSEQQEREVRENILKQQAKDARESKLSELRRKVNNAKKVKGVERQKGKFISDFSKYFLEATILRELGEVQETNTGFPPILPDSLALQCERPVSYRDMVDIENDLKEVKKISLYDLLGLSQNTTLQELEKKAKAEEDRIHKLPKSNNTADVLGRLAKKFIYFKNPEKKASYDLALKRYPFDYYCEDELYVFAQEFAEQQETDWKIYQDVIRQVKQIKDHQGNVAYNQAEADYLVYEYFVLKNNCPEPVDPDRPEPLPDEGTIRGILATVNFKNIFGG